MDPNVLWIAGFMSLAVLVWWFTRPRGTDNTAVIEALDAGARVIDVRSPGEFAAGHVDGAINVPVDTLGGEVKGLGPKDKPLVVYCASGMRSARARRLLLAAGYAQVVDAGAFSRFPKRS